MHSSRVERDCCGRASRVGASTSVVDFDRCPVVASRLAVKRGRCDQRPDLTVDVVKGPGGMVTSAGSPCSIGMATARPVRRSPTCPAMAVLARSVASAFRRTFQLQAAGPPLRRPARRCGLRFGGLRLHSASVIVSLGLSCGFDPRRPARPPPRLRRPLPRPSCGLFLCLLSASARLQAASSSACLDALLQRNPLRPRIGRRFCCTPRRLSGRSQEERPTRTWLACLFLLPGDKKMAPGPLPDRAPLSG